MKEIIKGKCPHCGEYVDIMIDVKLNTKVWYPEGEGC